MTDFSTREADLEACRKASQSRDPQIRANAIDAARKIVNESRRVREMRRALVKEHRNGNQENVRDIHDYIQKHSGYTNQK
jgi:hypothetical protein